jgi:hypothetical protein
MSRGSEHLRFKLIRKATMAELQQHATQNTRRFQILQDSWQVQPQHRKMQDFENTLQQGLEITPKASDINRFLETEDQYDQHDSSNKINLNYVFSLSKARNNFLINTDIKHGEKLRALLDTGADISLANIDQIPEVYAIVPMRSASKILSACGT